MNIDVLKSGWTEYELLDSGDRLKLERFGNVTVIRSEPKAWWKPSVTDLWRNADARYLDDEKKNAKWIFNGKPAAPAMIWNGVKFRTKFMDGTKHLGVFPEQSPHWDFSKKFYIARKAQAAQSFRIYGRGDSCGRERRLFGNTRGRLKTLRRLGAAKPNRKRSCRRAYTLDNRRRLKIRKTRGAQKFALRRDCSRPSRIWARAQKRALETRKNAARTSRLVLENPF